uniref:Pentraxin family member n=1 Tax=Accipiter nisus TaxID=211598 RepID=A0A8B9M1N9_9AVES
APALPVPMAQQEITFPAFYFPVENIESFVNVHPLHDMSLQAFTLCFWTKAQHAGSQTVLSYSTQERDNEIVITVGTDVGLWIGGHFITFPLYHKEQDWLHYCMAWASESGMANLWLNGAAGKAKSIQKGYVSQAGGTLVLGKDRDTLLGTFSNGFAGWMTHAHYAPDSVPHPFNKRANLHRWDRGKEQNRT